MPAASKKTDSRPNQTPRQAACRELLELRLEHADLFARIDAINARLKAFANTEGKFRETFAELGYVSVSPAKPAEKIGSAPVLQVAVWDELPDSRRMKLIDQGLVEIKSIEKRATYGQVRAKLHNEPEGDDE